MSESAPRTLKIAMLLCIACSIIVATAVVILRPMQNINKDLDFKKNILMAAGLMGPGTDIDEAFKQVQPIVVDLDSGTPVEGIDPVTFEQARADRDPQYLENIPAGIDLAGIKRRSRVQKIYLVKKDGKVDQIILHVYGKGLWSTMKGFLSLAPDSVTVRGFNFYSHAETPGLGGEVDNPKWIAQWPGKKVYTKDMKPAIDVLKSSVNPADPNAHYKIDGLSGATLTSVGVEGIFQYWLSENGYANFLKNVREGGLQ